MTVQTVKLAGEQYVLLKEKDYKQLVKGDASTKPQPALTKGRRRLTAQDRGDIAEAKRRRSEPATPYAQLRGELGLK